MEAHPRTKLPRVQLSRLLRLQLACLQRFLQLTHGFKYPAKTGGALNTVGLVENQEVPTVMQYLNSIPTLLMNGTTRLPKPVGADTKVRPLQAH